MNLSGKMSSSQDNNIFKKTSFLAGNNSAFIEEFYADYLRDPKNLPPGWKDFFDGLKDKAIYDIEGPSWDPRKKLKKKISKKTLLGSPATISID